MSKASKRRPFNHRRGIAAALAAGCVGYEYWTMLLHKRSKGQLRDTWSQIIRDVTYQDTVVGKRVLAWALRNRTEWFIRHLQEE